MYDLIGDIHGHADALVQLLERLGYRRQHGVYRHPERQVVFLGDFIDRGPQIRQVLAIVRAMVESGSALSVIGNHEFNALAYHTEDVDAPGEFLRRHTPGNRQQHLQTVEQLTPAELNSHLNWFRTLPLWLEMDGLRAVHACWDDLSIRQLAEAGVGQVRLTDSLLQIASRPGHRLFDSVETILKGKEAALPDGISFYDKVGHRRTSVRVRWYLSAENQTYRTYALTDEIDCDRCLDVSTVASAAPYPADAKPVFVGHYWLPPVRPMLLADNVACLDFSVAKAGFLCAYRWQGEQMLTPENFVWTPNVLGQ